MKTNTAIATLAIALLASTASYAAKSPAMEACSNQWQQMKSSGETQGKTWPSFWSQCSKNFATKNAGTTAAAPANGTTRRSAQRPTITAEANTNSAQLKKDCDAKWNANKASTGAHGWHDYFQFMSRCM